MLSPQPAIHEYTILSCIVVSCPARECSTSELQGRKSLFSYILHFLHCTCWVTTAARSTCCCWAYRCMEGCPLLLLLINACDTCFLFYSYDSVHKFFSLVLAKELWWAVTGSYVNIDLCKKFSLLLSQCPRASIPVLLLCNCSSFHLEKM